MEYLLKESQARMKELANSDDPESAHIEADEILVELLKAYGCPEEITTHFTNMTRWYA